MATVVKESEGSPRLEEEASPGRDGERTKGEIRLFIPGPVSGIFIGLDEKAPCSPLAAIILHPIHSSSLF